MAFSKTMAGVGDLKRICTDAFFVAGAVQEASSAEMFGAQGADFLISVAQWEISQVSVLEARLSMERVSFLAALPSLQHVTLLLPEADEGK